uniref:MobA/MobL family protein n=1 Tax=Clostridium perfringens TaxID=1502 RepID=UPI0032DA0823
MAIFHSSSQIISRSKGKSSVGASAYRSGEKIYNERDGIEHDYSRKKGVVFKEILAPENAPTWAKNRARLWNEV